MFHPTNTSNIYDLVTSHTDVISGGMGGGTALETIKSISATTPLNTLKKGGKSVQV